MPSGGGCSGLATNVTTSPGISYTLLAHSSGARVKASRPTTKLAFGVFGWSTCAMVMTTGPGLPSQLPTESRILLYEDTSSCASSDWAASTLIGLPLARSFVLGMGNAPAGEGDGQVGERDGQGEQGGCHLLRGVQRPAVGDQGAGEQQDHPGGRRHAEGVPPQAGQDARGGGQFGYPDEPVVVPGDAEVG